MDNQQLEENMEFNKYLKKVFFNDDITLIEYNGIKKPLKYRCNKCKTIYSVKKAKNILSSNTLCCKCNKKLMRWALQDIKEQMKNRFGDTFEIISYQGKGKPGKTRCLLCGKVKEFTRWDNQLQKLPPYCDDCNLEKNLIYKHMIEELNKYKKIKLIKWNGVNEKNEFQCLNCGHRFFKTVRKEFNGKLCPNCHKAHNSFDFKEAEERVREALGKDYKLLQFKNTASRILIRHNCGFTYSLKFNSLKNHRGCPKCKKTYSKLEQKVEEWLKKNNFNYERQKRFKDFARFSFDFYIMGKYPICIEVQGRQHYEPVSVFDDLEIQQERDNKKREYCLINNIILIEIPYDKVDDLDNFFLQFNDYLEKE